MSKEKRIFKLELISVFVFFFIAFEVYSENREVNHESNLVVVPVYHKQLIMLDAGSSGVRALSYDFERKSLDLPFQLSGQSEILEGPPITLDNSLSNEILERLQWLINKPLGSGIYPEKSFFLGGTAGLRAVARVTESEMSVAKILIGLTAQLHARAFEVTYKKNIRLLSGLEEAAFTWLAVNYVMQTLKSPKFQYGVIELGGGSVQMAFRVPLNREDHIAEKNELPDFRSAYNIYRFVLANSSHIDVYGESYLYFGLNKAYEKYIRNEGNKSDMSCSNRLVGSETASPVWEQCAFAMTQLFNSPGCSMFHCYSNSSIRRGLPKEFYLNGYFYDRTTALGLPDRLTPQLIKNAAQYVCGLTEAEVVRLHSSHTEGSHLFFDEFRESQHLEKPVIKPFLNSGKPRAAKAKKLCAELTYISILLEMFGLDPKHNLISVKSLEHNSKTYGISWPLGYALAWANDWLASGKAKGLPMATSFTPKEP